MNNPPSLLIIFCGILLGAFLGVVIGMFLTGCTVEPRRQFNSRDTQNGPCYATYMGESGYCDKRSQLEYPTN